MTAGELMALLGVSENTLYPRLRPNGDLHHLTIPAGGRSVRISGLRVLRLLGDEPAGAALKGAR